MVSRVSSPSLTSLRCRRFERKVRMSRRIVYEKNTRIAGAYVSSHGLSAKQLLLANKARAGKTRPLRVVKPQVKPDPNLLLAVPVTGTKTAIEYPTPDWFRSLDKADVSVIVPLYRSMEVVKELIASWPLGGDLKWEAIFVDDKCPQNSKDIVLRDWTIRRDQLQRPVGKIVVNTENKGFGLTCNTGAEFATGDHLIFLNADTRLTPNWIEPIIDVFKQGKNVGVVGNLQIKDGGMWDGTIDGAGSEWVWSKGCFEHIGRHSYERKDMAAPYMPTAAPKDIMKVGNREMVTGCCLAIPSELFQYVGGFNPNYRIGYWEDSELCLAISELGYKVMFTPHSKIYHKLSHTNSGGHAFQNYNKQFFYNKWVNSGRIDQFVLDKRPSKPEVRTILLKRSGAHGDVLVAAAVSPALKKKHKCNILFLTDCPEVLKGNPYVDRVVNHSEISERQFQVYYDLDMAYEYRPKANMLDAYAQTVGVMREDCEIYLHQEPIDKLPEKFVAFHVGLTNWKGRNWTNGNFDALAVEVQKLGHKIVLIGRGGDHACPCDLDLRGKTSIAQLAFVMKEADFFVGIDSFPMHIAQATKTPGVCFFGSIRPETRIVNENMHGITAPSMPCLGCHHRKPTPCVVTNNCEVGGEPCLTGVTVSMMLEKIKELTAR